jgi:hypothetical protein
MRIHQLIEELRHIEPVKGHKAALDIHRMLEGNRTLFAAHIDERIINQLTKQFEELATARSGYYQTELFKREFNNAYELLMFYMRKVV